MAPAPDSSEDPAKKLSGLKSEIWEQAGKEAMDENLDFDRAAENFYAKIVAKLEESLGAGSMSEEEYHPRSISADDKIRQLPTP